MFHATLSGREILKRILNINTDQTDIGLRDIGTHGGIVVSGVEEARDQLTKSIQDKYGNLDGINYAGMEGVEALSFLADYYLRAMEVTVAERELNKVIESCLDEATDLGLLRHWGHVEDDNFKVTIHRGELRVGGKDELIFELSRRCTFDQTLSLYNKLRINLHSELAKGKVEEAFAVFFKNSINASEKSKKIA